MWVYVLHGLEGLVSVYVGMIPTLPPGGSGTPRGEGDDLGDGPKLAKARILQEQGLCLGRGQG